jgi:hypothetical protein
LAELESFIIEDRRIDETELSGLSADLLSEIATAYGTQRMALLVKWFQAKFGQGGSTR